MPHNTGHVYAFQPSALGQCMPACQHSICPHADLTAAASGCHKGVRFLCLAAPFPPSSQMDIYQASKQASKQTSKKHIILAARRKDRNTQPVLLWCMRDLWVGLANCWWHWALKFSKLQSSVGGISQKPCHYFDVTRHRGTPPYSCVDSPECSNAICQLVVEGATSVAVGS